MKQIYKDRAMPAEASYQDPEIDVYLTMHDIARSMLESSDIKLIPGDSIHVDLDLMGYKIATIDIKTRKR